MLLKRTLLLLVFLLALVSVAFAQDDLVVGQTFEGNADGETIYYVFRAEAGKGYIIDLSTPRFDGYLEVRKLDSTSIAYNDDFGDSSKSRVFFLLSEDTPLAVSIGSYSSEDFKGGYTLKVSEAPSSELAYGDTAEVQDTDATEGYYTFTGKKDDVINLFVTNDDNDSDTSLSLKLDGVEVTYDYDNGANYFPYIRHYRLPEDATYLVVLSGYYDNTLSGSVIHLEKTELPTAKLGTPIEISMTEADYEVVGIPILDGTSYTVEVAADTTKGTSFTLEITLPGETYSTYYINVTSLNKASGTFTATESGTAILRIVGSSYDPVSLSVTVTEDK